MKYVGLILLLLGAAISYPAKKIAEKIKDEPAEGDVLKIKVFGFALVIIGVVFVLVFS